MKKKIQDERIKLKYKNDTGVLPRKQKQKQDYDEVIEIEIEIEINIKKKW